METKKCEKCGKNFNPVIPYQNICGDCEEKMMEEVEKANKNNKEAKE